MKVDNEIYFALVEEQLAAGERVKIPLVGTSMQPTLVAGDVIVLEQPREVTEGDVVLFRYKGRHLLHRVVEIKDNCYTMQGDNCVATETVQKEDIVAKMVDVEKKRPLKHLIVRWLGYRGRKKLRPWYFIALAILMWAPLNGFGIPMDEYVLGLRFDHLLHASVFIPCALFLWDLFRKDSSPSQGGRGVQKYAVWALAVGIGVLTETVQWLLPYRGFDINDMVANFLGVSLGWLVILIVKRNKMKTMKLMLAMTIVAMGAVSCGSNNEKQEGTQNAERKAQKVLVVYYSQNGHTQTLAQEIAKKTGADIEAVEAVNPYDGDFNATIARCMQEREAGTAVEINPVKANVADYDIIFVGAPVWFGIFAPPMLTYLDQVDLSGKKVVPFCTFGSGGLESSTQDLAKRQPKAEILPGYGVREARMEAMPQEVDQFLKSGGFIEGEYTKLADFPEQHEVNADETAIFDDAVDGYPMLHAQAKTVAIRSLPQGKEYLFTAVDLPREGKPDMPPAGELKVYVTVANGAAPVFTKVIR